MSTKRKKFSRNKKLHDDRHSHVPLVPRMYELLQKDELLKKHPWSEVYVWNFVETGYRSPVASSYECLCSLFYPHNELVNSWSHGLAALYMLYLISNTLEQGTDSKDVAVIVIYLLCFTLMFSFSTVYHIFCCHSEPMCRNVQCFDWLGISIGCLSANLMSSYFELKALPAIFFTVFNVMNVGLFLTTYYITYSNIQNSYSELDPSKVFRKYVLRVFVCVAFSLGALLSWILRYTYDGTFSPTLYNILGSYACYSSLILGVVHVPERFLPVGAVDIVVSVCAYNICVSKSQLRHFLFVSRPGLLRPRQGYSHQIFHVIAIGGAYLLWRAYV